MVKGGAPQAEKTERQVNDGDQIEVANSPFRMASVDRVSKLPVVEETVKMVNNLYGKVRGANSFFNWSLKKAEFTASNVANFTAPVLIKLQGPIGTLDGVLCVGLDYVESKVPAVKLPPNEIYVNTKQSVSESIQPCLNCASAMKDYGTNKVMEVCRACGVCEPGAFDGPDVQEENGGDVPALDLRTSSHFTLESKTGSAPASVSH